MEILKSDSAETGVDYSPPKLQDHSQSPQTLRKLPDHIKTYLMQQKGGSAFIELFESSDEDFDLKTELNKKEIVVANVIMLNDLFMCSKGCYDNIFSMFRQGYLRHRVSLDRKSRAEFVKINQRDNFQENLNTFDSFKNLQDLKK